MNALFITGTDTDSGKTFVSASLLHTLQQHAPELKLIARKPIASGCQKTENGLHCEDAYQLQQALQNNESLSDICPYQLIPPISPERAIRFSNQKITIQDLQKACQPKQITDFLLVEGAGGFYSPLALDGTNASLAKALSFPVILVVGNKLGCINHFLLSQTAIQAEGLELAGIIVNDLSPTADRQNFLDIAQRAAAPCLHLPFQSHKKPAIIDGLESIKPLHDLLKVP